MIFHLYSVPADYWSAVCVIIKDIADGELKYGCATNNERPRITTCCYWSKLIIHGVKYKVVHAINI